jgi:hypothetical protein
MLVDVEVCCHTGIMFYVSESIDGKPPIITIHDTGYQGPLPSDGSVDFPVSIGGYYRGTNGLTGTRMSFSGYHHS